MKAKGLLVLGLATAAVFAQADLTFSDVEATVTFDGTDEFDLTVLEGRMGIDFTAGELPIYVDSVESEYSSAVINISYTAEIGEEDDNITGLELVFSGWAMGDGSITYEETVFDGEGNEIASVSGTLDDDTPFTQTDFLQFDGVGTYRVEKTFTLDLNQANGTGNDASLASIGLIEQNAVPEPATMGALAVGALGLMARRRRK